MLGKWGNYWAIFFKLNLIHYTFIIFKRTGFLSLLHYWVDVSKNRSQNKNHKHNIYIHYYLELLGNDENGEGKYAYGYVGRFIYLGLFWSQWYKPLLSKLLHLYLQNKPIYLIYGDNDIIMPYHQGSNICSLVESCDQKCSKYKIQTIPDAGHVPYTENKDLFCQAISNIVEENENLFDVSDQRSEEISNNKNNIMQKILTNNLLTKFLTRYFWGSYSLKCTSDVISKQYKLCRELTQHLRVHN